MSASPVLICCSHGTADAAGQAAVRDLVDQVRVSRPGLDVWQTWVDVQTPQLDEVVAALPAGRRAVIVPVLLSTGFHVKSDIARAAVHPGVTATAPLGPDPVLARILADRLDAAGLRPGDAVVLAAAGSSDADSVPAVAQVATDLAALVDRQPTIGYATARDPSVHDAVAAAGSDGSRVLIATYLLAPGFFFGRVAREPAAAMTAALAPDPLLAALILRRYDEATDTR